MAWQATGCDLLTSTGQGLSAAASQSHSQLLNNHASSIAEHWQQH
jgi:hypothetical protein